MNEELLFYLWKFRLFNQSNLFTNFGNPVTVVHPGTWNTSSGPDFFNARLRIGHVTWNGNVEIHVKSSDFLKHGHQHNPNYQQLILHVVWEHNKEFGLETLELKPHVNPGVITTARKLKQTENTIACSSWLNEVPSIYITSWLERLIIERLEQKAKEVLSLVKTKNGNWQATLEHFIFKSMGLTDNSLPFELLYSSLPAGLITKYQNQLLLLQALLAGQSGLITDNWPQLLQKEYQYLTKKHGLIPLDKNLWKTGRMLPKNAASNRLLQLASILHYSSISISQLCQLPHPDSLVQRLTGKEIQAYPEMVAFPGKQKATTLLLNAYLPVMFAKGHFLNDLELKNKAIDWLLQTEPEENTIVAQFTKAGIMPTDAAQSQALLQLFKHYCRKKRCMECGIGNSIFKFCNFTYVTP